MNKTLTIKEHSTPYTHLPDRQDRVVRLSTVKQARGYYRMENVNGYDFYYCTKPTKVKQLQVLDNNWHTLMVDDPIHWLGMKELAQLTLQGTVLVGGLGLGLILFHLTAREDITAIKVVEIDPEVIKFIKPHLPSDSRLEIVQADFFTYLLNTSEKFNTTIVDLWVLNEESTAQARQQVATSMGVARALAKQKGDKVLIWGVRGY